MNLDITKFDITKLDIRDIKIIQWIALGFLLFVFLMDLFLFSFLIEKVDRVNAQRQQDLSAVSFFKNLISNKDKLTNARLVPPEKIDDLSDRIQKIAKENHLEAKMGVYLNSDGQDRKMDFYMQRNLSVTASGTLKNMGIFLTKVRNMPDAVIDIGSIDLSNDQNNLSNVQAQIKFVILTTVSDETQ